MSKKFRKGYVGRALTCDVAITYRMGAGFPGDVVHAVGDRIEPAKQSATAPVLGYGFGCLVDTATNSVRQMTGADNNAAASKLYGVVVRPTPIQQQSASDLNAAFGSGAPPASGAIDVIREGSIIVKVTTGAVTKDGPAYIWCTASAGADIQGAFRGSASAGNTMLISNARFNGPADADGYAVLQIWQRD